MCPGLGALVLGAEPGNLQKSEWEEEKEILRVGLLVCSCYQGLASPG